MNFWRRLKNRIWLADALSLLGALWYFAQAWRYAHTLASMLDEGAFLLKGLFFVTGRYHPFQPYGPWTNKMPLAFLIPGVVQAWLGPGLRPARYFMIAWGLMTLLGLWLLARRLNGHWAAALTVWVIALNPWLIKTYTLAISQGLTAGLFVWMLVFWLGPNRPRWQILVGAFFAVALVFTRQNMVLALPFLLVYLFWEHGKRAGWQALALVSLGIGIGHALWWPEILTVWANWLPARLTPFLDPWRLAKLVDAQKVSPIVLDGQARLLSLMEGFRAHWLALLGGLTPIFFWPERKNKRYDFRFRIAVSVTLTFLLLTVAHAWAALGLNYCVFCFAPYQAFFAPLGWLVFLAFWPLLNWKRRSGWFWASVLVLLLIGVGWASYADLGYPLLDTYLGRKILSLSNGVSLRFLGTPLRDAQEPRAMLVTTVLAVPLALVVVGFLAWLAHQKNWRTSVSFLLAVSLLLSPTALFGGEHYPYDCGDDVLTAYEQFGAALREKGLAGRVYWYSDRSAVPLLYVADRIQVYPPQLNGSFSYWRGGDSDVLSRFGFWNDTLEQIWAADADYWLLNWSKYHNTVWLLELKDRRQFTPLLKQPAICDPKQDPYVLFGTSMAGSE